MRWVLAAGMAAALYAAPAYIEKTDNACEALVGFDAAMRHEAYKPMVIKMGGSLVSSVLAQRYPNRPAEVSCASEFWSALWTGRTFESVLDGT